MQTKGLMNVLSNLADSNHISFGIIVAIIVINVLLIAGVKLVFDGIEYVTEGNKPSFKLKKLINYSSIIGLIERFLYISGIWTSSFELITVVIAVKTVMRFTSINAVENGDYEDFEKSDEKITAEKYILGTLLNLLVSLVIVGIFK